MKFGAKFTLAAAVLSLAGVGLWFAFDNQEPPLLTAEASAPLAADPTEVAHPLAPTTPAREAVGAQAEGTAVGAARVAPLPVAALSKSTSRVLARFVDTTGQPWDQVSFREANTGKPSTTGGPDGRAELTFEDSGAEKDVIVQLLATREGCATHSMRATLTRKKALDLGEVVLEREGRVQGMVQDSHGTGLADITVGVSVVELDVADPGQLRRHGSWQFDRLITTKSDARGGFDLRGVPSGHWRLWGNAEDRGYGVSEPFELEAGEEKLGVNFEVPALLVTDSIRGRVIDPAGQGVANANLTLSYESVNTSGTSGFTAKQDGSFEVLIQMEVSSDLVAADPQHRWAEASASAVPPGARGVILQLLDPSAQPKARVVVHGPANEPVRVIKLESRAGKRNSYSATEISTRELEPGQFEFQVPTTAFGLTVAAPGYLDSDLIKFDPANFPAETEVRLALAPVLRGRVTANGVPLGGANIESKRALQANSDLTFNGFPCVMAPHTQVQATAAADGSFSLMLQAEKSVYLRCSAPGFAASIFGPIQVDSAPALIEIELNVGGAIEGHVRAEDGTTVVDAIVGVTCGDGHPRTMRSGHDGVFRFEGLTTTRPWLVLEREAEFRTDVTSTSSSDKEAHIDWSCEVTVGRTTYHDLQLNH